jgi:Amiloride-sensitive sodium channel
MIFHNKALNHKIFFPGKELTRICDEYNDSGCFDLVTMSVNDKNSSMYQSCNCLPACNSITYHYDIISRRINNQSQCVSPDLTSKTSLTSIYFADDEFVVFKRSASVTRVDLLAKIGGFIVFFLGASVLSAVEIFYFFVVKFVNDVWWY